MTGEPEREIVLTSRIWCENICPRQGRDRLQSASQSVSVQCWCPLSDWGLAQCCSVLPPLNTINIQSVRQWGTQCSVFSEQQKKDFFIKLVWWVELMEELRSPVEFLLVVWKMLTIWNNFRPVNQPNIIFMTLRDGGFWDWETKWKSISWSLSSSPPSPSPQLNLRNSSKSIVETSVQPARAI